MLPIYSGTRTNTFHVKICFRNVIFYVVKLTYKLSTQKSQLVT